MKPQCLLGWFTLSGIAWSSEAAGRRRRRGSSSPSLWKPQRKSPHKSTGAFTPLPSILFARANGLDPYMWFIDKCWTAHCRQWRLSQTPQRIPSTAESQGCYVIDSRCCGDGSALKFYRRPGTCIQRTFRDACVCLPNHTQSNTLPPIPYIHCFVRS